MRSVLLTVRAQRTTNANDIIWRVTTTPPPNLHPLPPPLLSLSPPAAQTNRLICSGSFAVSRYAEVYSQLSPAIHYRLKCYLTCIA